MTIDPGPGLVARIFIANEWYDVALGTFERVGDGFTCCDAKTGHLLVGPLSSIERVWLDPLREPTQPSWERDQSAWRSGGSDSSTAKWPITFSSNRTA
jgi:hypothetical protein